MTGRDGLIALGMTGAVLALTTWSRLRSSRVEYEPTTPLIVATALSVGPEAAPTVLLAQAIALACWDAYTHKRALPHFVINVGMMTLWHGALGAAMGPLTSTTVSTAQFVGALLAITLLAVMLNNLTVAVSAAYVYRDSRGPDLGLPDQARDVVASVGLGWAIRGIPGPDWMEAILLVAFALYLGWLIVRHREHRAALLVEVQTRIEHKERTQTGRSHSATVAETVAALVGDTEPLAVPAAWCHSISVDQSPHRCAGIQVDGYAVTALRSLPGHSRIERHIPRRGLIVPSSTEVSQVIAAACAWDSRRLPGSPVRCPDDLVYTIGVDPEIADRVVALDPEWVKPDPRLHRAR